MSRSKRQKLDVETKYELTNQDDTVDSIVSYSQNFAFSIGNKIVVYFQGKFVEGIVVHRLELDSKYLSSSFDWTDLPLMYLIRLPFSTPNGKQFIVDQWFPSTVIRNVRALLKPPKLNDAQTSDEWRPTFDSLVYDSSIRFPAILESFLVQDYLSASLGSAPPELPRKPCVRHVLENWLQDLIQRKLDVRKGYRGISSAPRLYLRRPLHLPPNYRLSTSGFSVEMAKEFKMTKTSSLFDIIFDRIVFFRGLQPPDVFQILSSTPHSFHNSISNELSLNRKTALPPSEIFGTEHLLVLARQGLLRFDMGMEISRGGAGFNEAINDLLNYIAKNRHQLLEIRKKIHTGLTSSDVDDPSASPPNDFCKNSENSQLANPNPENNDKTDRPDHFSLSAILGVPPFVIPPNDIQLLMQLRQVALTGYRLILLDPKFVLDPQSSRAVPVNSPDVPEMDYDEILNLFGGSAEWPIPFWLYDWGQMPTLHGKSGKDVEEQSQLTIEG